MEEILMSRDNVIFPLQHLAFVLNLDKTILNPVQDVEFIGVTINSFKMCLYLPQEKVLKIQDIHATGQVALHEFRKLLDLLASTI